MKRLSLSASLPLTLIVALAMAPACSDDSPSDGPGDAGEGEGEGEGAGGGGGGEPPFTALDFGEAGTCERLTVDPANFDQKAVVMTKLTIDGAFGFDLDDTPGIDNKLGGNALLKSTASQQVQASILEGELLLVLEYRGAADLKASDCFDLNFYLGNDPGEDPATALGGSGSLEVDARSITADGHPVVRFPNAKIVDTPEKGPVVFARTDEWVLSVAIDASSTLNLTIGNASLQAEVGADGAIAEGVLGGMISKASLLTEIKNAGLDIGGIDIAGLVGEPDQDADGDGCFESYSIGLRFEAAPVTLTGLAAEPAEGEGEPEGIEDTCQAESDAMTCGGALDCSLGCVEAAAGGMDFDCFACCIRNTQSADSVEKLRSLLNCPIEECAKASDGTVVSEPADIEACLVADFGASLDICRTDAVVAGGEAGGEGEGEGEAAGEGEGEGEAAGEGEGEGEAAGEGEGEGEAAGEGEGEGEGEAAGEGEGEGEGE